MFIRVLVLVLMACTSWAKDYGNEYKYRFSNGNELIYNYSSGGQNLVAFKDVTFNKSYELAIGQIHLSSSSNQGSSYRVEKSFLNLNPNEKSFAVSLVDSFLFVTFENGKTVVIDKSVESDMSSLQIRHEKINSSSWVVVSYYRDQAKQQGYTYILNSEGQIERLRKNYHNLSMKNYFFNAEEKSFSLDGELFRLRSFEEAPLRLETPIEILDKRVELKNTSEIEGALMSTLSKEEYQRVTNQSQDINPREVGADGAVEEKIEWYEPYAKQLQGVDVIHNVDENLKRRIYEALVDPESGSAALVSKPGAGKTTLANLIAWEILNNKAPSYFDGYQVLYFDASSISAGSKYRGEFEQRVQELKEVSNNSKVLWVVDNFTSLKGQGSHSNNSSDILDMIAPDLNKGKIRILAMADIDLYDQVVTNEQIRSKITKIDVNQVWGESELVKAIQNYVQQKYDYKLSPEHVQDAIKLSEKGEATGQEPARSLRLIRKAMNKKLLISKDETFELTKKAIQDSAVELYGFDPAEYKPEAGQEKIAKLESALRTNVIGQDAMVDATLKAARLVYTNTHDDSKARMGIFFTGPRGLGKTEVPKIYAEVMGKPFYRISMGQYSTPEPGTLEKLKHSIYRELQKNPHTVLFFDELDKSPVFIQDGLLELFDSKTFNVREKLDSSGSLSKIVHVDISQADVFFAGNSAVEYIYSLSLEQREESTHKIGFHAAQERTETGRASIALEPQPK